MAGNHYMVNLTRQFRQQAVTEWSEMLYSSRHVSCSQFGSLAQANNSRDILRTGTPPSLLHATIEERHNAHSFPHPEGGLKPGMVVMLLSMLMDSLMGHMQSN